MTHDLDALIAELNAITTGSYGVIADSREYVVKANDMLKILDASRRAAAALEAAKSQVAEGWQLVPIKPTEAMLRRANQYVWFYDVNEDDTSEDQSAEAKLCWHAMLLAAPSPPTEGGEK